MSGKLAPHRRPENAQTSALIHPPGQKGWPFGLPRALGLCLLHGTAGSVVRYAGEARFSRGSSGAELPFYFAAYSAFALKSMRSPLPISYFSYRARAACGDLSNENLHIFLHIRSGEGKNACRANHLGHSDADSKSAAVKSVSVRLRPRAPTWNPLHNQSVASD